MPYSVLHPELQAQKAIEALSHAGKLVSFDELPNKYVMQQKGALALDDIALPYYVFGQDSDMGDRFRTAVPTGGGAEPYVWQEVVMGDIAGEGQASWGIFDSPVNYTNGFTPVLAEATKVYNPAHDDNPATTVTAGNDNAQGGQVTKTQEADTTEGTKETQVTASNPYYADDDRVHPVFGEDWG